MANGCQLPIPSLKAAAPFRYERHAIIRAPWDNALEAFEVSLEHFKANVDLFLSEFNVASFNLSITTLDSGRKKSTLVLKGSNEASNASRALSHGVQMAASLSYLNGLVALRLTCLRWRCSNTRS
ncbi:hypothetical protein L3X38_037732 [Prunus dulcis]|uniref:Uncharacterized protein n=1 Tax=Prunus dulcis TaxID=3755 RepID=A0AAD4YQY9_PRUDU|nr:hypothetical protein L3X38_037732 [Prunus dulcis]